MTRKQNYFKIVGTKAFIDAALKVIDQKFQVVFQTDVRESDSASDIFFVYVNIADKFMEVLNA
jgi:hypothetical protein